MKNFRAVVYLLVFTVPFSQVSAAMMTTDQVISSLAKERAQIEKLVLRDEIQSKLKTLGISSEEATRRVASLSDHEVRQVAAHMDVMPVGGEPVIVIGLGAVLVGVLLYLLLRR